VAIDAAAVIVWRRRAMTSIQQPPPGYLGAAAVLMITLGFVIFVFPLGTPSGVARALGAVAMTGGVGLVFGQRWAWPSMLATAIPMLGLGCFFAVASGNTYAEHPAAPDAFALIGSLLLAIGCLLVVASTRRATRDWLMRRS